MSLIDQRVSFEFRGEQVMSVFIPERTVRVGTKLMSCAPSYLVKFQHIGFAVYAARDLRKGEVAAIYTGELVRGRHNLQACRTHVLSLSSRVFACEHYIDGSLHGTFDLEFYVANGVASFMNSETKALINCKFASIPRVASNPERVYSIPEAGEPEPTWPMLIYMETTRPVAAGEQLLWRYECWGDFPDVELVYSLDLV